MKKTVFMLALIIIVNIMSGQVVNASDVIGYTTKSDIVSYINHYPVKSFNINGKTAIVAEHLFPFGFLVDWNASERTLKISHDKDCSVAVQYTYSNGYFLDTDGNRIVKMCYGLGENQYPIYSTDIKVYIDNQIIESFNIGGQTAIYMDDLSKYGDVVWVEEQRALKLWIDWKQTYPGGFQYPQNEPAPKEYSAKSYDIPTQISPDTSIKQKRYTVYAEQGAVITNSSPDKAQYLYKRKCETCGKISTQNYAGTVSGSGLNSSFWCTDCKKHQSVKIRHSIDYVN